MTGSSRMPACMSWWAAALPTTGPWITCSACWLPHLAGRIERTSTSQQRRRCSIGSARLPGPLSAVASVTGSSRQLLATSSATTEAPGS